MGEQENVAEQEIKVKLKLLVDQNANKVLFAEARKDFVDFLFHMMSLPAGTIVKLIGLKGMVGCLGDLYKSIESFDNDYMQENTKKDSVLDPKSNLSVPLLLLNESHTALYKCSATSYVASSACAMAVSDDPKRICSACNRPMNARATYLHSGSTGSVTNSGSEAKGFVKGVVTYMVMDNLEIKPLSTIAAITLLNKFHVKDVGSLVEKEVQIGLTEGVAILKASLETKAVLSAAFLGGKF